MNNMDALFCNSSSSSSSSSTLIFGALRSINIAICCISPVFQDPLTEKRHQDFFRLKTSSDDMSGRNFCTASAFKAFHAKIRSTPKLSVSVLLPAFFITFPQKRGE